METKKTARIAGKVVGTLVHPPSEAATGESKPKPEKGKHGFHFRRTLIKSDEKGNPRWFTRGVDVPAGKVFRTMDGAAYTPLESGQVVRIGKPMGSKKDRRRARRLANTKKEIGS